MKVDYLQKILGDFETHHVHGIRACFENGISPNQMYNGKPLVYEFINMYLRSPGFKDCIRAFVEYGLEFEDETLLAVLLDDASDLEDLIIQDKTILSNQYSLDAAFTPLYKTSLLHICAEYNHVACAKVLINHGVGVNTTAGLDAHGFGGHTPIFHTVNQHDNQCIDMLKFLVSQDADLNLTVKGLIWGKGYEWETFIPSVNPVSYAMMGLLRQFQRTEVQIYQVVSILMKAKYGIDFNPENIPNKYLPG
ncbi:MAG: ankyrin repeat domain-containing protein [Saprospiraceae bacterium]